MIGVDSLAWSRGVLKVVFCFSVRFAHLAMGVLWVFLGSIGGCMPVAHVERAVPAKYSVFGGIDRLAVDISPEDPDDAEEHGSAQALSRRLKRTLGELSITPPGAQPTLRTNIHIRGQVSFDTFTVEGATSSCGVDCKVVEKIKHVSYDLELELFVGGTEVVEARTLSCKTTARADARGYCLSELGSQVLDYFRPHQQKEEFRLRTHGELADLDAGNRLMKERDYGAASAAYGRAIEQARRLGKPALAVAYASRAMAKGAAGATEEGLQDVEQALSLNPQPSYQETRARLLRWQWEETILAWQLSVAAYGLGSDPPPKALDAAVPPRDAAACEGGPGLEGYETHCYTPRLDPVAGHLSVEGGVFALRPHLGRRTGLLPGFLIQLRLGLSLWDHLLITSSLGNFRAGDSRPFREHVVSCPIDEAQGQECSSSETKESITQAGVVGLEVGAQHRFRPLNQVSVVPGVVLGGQVPFSNFVRKLACEGCPAPQDMGTSPGGTYAGGFVRVTFGRYGFVAGILRSLWFLTGDLQHAQCLAVEVGLP